MIHVAGHDKDTGGSGARDRGHGVGVSRPLMEEDGGGQCGGILDWGLETGLGVSGRWGECLPGCRWELIRRSSEATKAFVHRLLLCSYTENSGFQTAALAWPAKAPRLPAKKDLYSRRAYFPEVSAKVQDSGGSETQGNSCKCAFRFLSLTVAESTSLSLSVKTCGNQRSAATVPLAPAHSLVQERLGADGSAERCTFVIVRLLRPSVSSPGRWVRSHSEIMFLFN